MHPRYAGIIQISLEGLFSAPPINGAPLENRLQRYKKVLNNAKKQKKKIFCSSFLNTPSILNILISTPACELQVQSAALAQTMLPSVA